MIEQFKSVIYTLIQPAEKKGTLCLFDATAKFDEKITGNAGMAQSLNAAFLIALCGDMHPASGRAKGFLTSALGSTEWANAANFYLDGLDLVHREIKDTCEGDPIFSKRLKGLFEWLSKGEDKNDTQETAERIWSVFFPEANGILGNEQKRVEALRAKRVVTVTALNMAPITDPPRQMLFTANVLLTCLPQSMSPEELPYSDHLRKKLLEISCEPQLSSYDHPVQVGVEPENNEVLYGLKGFEEAFEFERGRGNLESGVKPICVLSVSTTHRSLQDIARRYLEEELVRSTKLKNIDVYAFTETDTQHLIDEILSPAAVHYLHEENAKEYLSVFGVDGEYGRHYSFLKAIAAFWKIFLQPEIKATFKIDLDQVFPQKELVEHNNATAFEHFKTPLWGAHGLDSNGKPLELGMIAGALVNQKEIGRSLYTPDVPFPNRSPFPDEYIFFSMLPQALSTEAEMMTRYDTNELDGQRRCIQRIHVTGGTTGILVNSLRRYRPFTPSFIGRAEDQAYILSVLLNPGTKLAYVHKDGLFMRHDKEAFAQEAIQSAYVDKLVGDYVRIIYFSEYAKALADDVRKLKEIIDPFTGCFVSKIPKTVVHLRFAFKVASLFAEGEAELALDFLHLGAERIVKALDFVNGESRMLRRRCEKERLSWDLYYDTLSAAEEGLENGEDFALDLRKKAENIVSQCAIRS